jgi:hypothetical protein
MAADLPEIVKRATGLSAAIAADLAVAGGILRCAGCGSEQPVGDIALHLSRGWPQCCGQVMTWVTLKLLAAETREVPDGHELVAAESKDWRLAAGKRCRAGAGPGRHACGRPSVAELKRGSKQYPSWWAYCLDHLYANWIEDGQVWHWILRAKEGTGA